MWVRLAAAMSWPALASAVMWATWRRYRMWVRVAAAMSASAVMRVMWWRYRSWVLAVLVVGAVSALGVQAVAVFRVARDDSAGEFVALGLTTAAGITAVALVAAALPWLALAGMQAMWWRHRLWVLAVLAVGAVPAMGMQAVVTLWVVRGGSAGEFVALGLTTAAWITAVALVVAALPWSALAGIWATWWRHRMWALVAALSRPASPASWVMWRRHRGRVAALLGPALAGM